MNTSLNEDAASPFINAYHAAITNIAIIAITDVKGNIVYANDNFCNISGYERDELIGKNHRILKSGHHDASFFKCMWKQIANGKTWRGELKNKAKDGSYYWVDTIITPILDKNNKPEQYLSLRFDITDKKRNEQKVLKNQKEQIKLNAFKNQLIYTISHDIKSPLKTLKGLVNLLDLKMVTPEELEAGCLLIKNKLTYTEKILDDLVVAAENNYSYEKGNEPVNFNETLKDSINLFSNEIKSKKLILSENIDKSIQIKSKTDIITIIIRNLLHNAIKYSPKKGKIDIEVENCQFKNCVVFKITDSGPGMSKQILSDLQSGKRIVRDREETDNGSGIGLALSKQFIINIGGEFIINSNPGEGCCIGFTLPKHQVQTNKIPDEILNEVG